LLKDRIELGAFFAAVVYAAAWKPQPWLLVYSGAPASKEAYDEATGFQRPRRLLGVTAHRLVRLPKIIRRFKIVQHCYQPLNPGSIARQVKLISASSRKDDRLDDAFAAQ
jgi:hypothetical protein